MEIVTQVDISVENPTEFHEIAAAASSTVQLISGIPNGIYAFESNVGSNMFMKSAKSSPQEGDSMTIFQQNNASSMPYIRGLPVATFEITKKESSGTYIIRLGANESLTLAISGTSVITKSIPENDSDVAIEDTFYISSYARGYTIRPYSSNSYIASKTDSSGLTVMASINNRAIWFPRGYRAYIDDGVYALLNRENTTSWIGTAENDFLGTKLARTYERSTCPAADFQRNCLFKITQIGTSGEYVIRLMTNNLLTWSVRTDGKVFSRPISYDDSQITDTSQKYYIVFDKNAFMIVPCGNINDYKMALGQEDSTTLDEFGETVSYISTVERVNATNSARWLMYKYIGPDRCGADIILPDEIESIGAIVGNTYTISHTVWYTKEDMFDFSVSAIDSSFNDVSFEYDSDNYTATMTVHNLGEISYYVLSKRMVDGVPMMSISADVSFYVIPQEGTYYLQNSHSNLYANVINHSTDNGAIIHQLGFSTDSRFKWEIEHVEDSGGYVLLKSQLSNMYMGVDLDSSSTQTRIRQYEDVGDNTLWRFETLDDGSVKIICKATESSGKVLAVPNVLPGTGEWLTQYTYTDDQNRNDEWYFFDIKYLFTINSYYDNGQTVRYGDSTIEDIWSTQKIANDYFLKIFGVHIYSQYPVYYMNLPDICKGNVTESNLNAICCDLNHIWTVDERIFIDERGKEYTVFYNCFCTDRSSYIETFSVNGDSADTYILWSGHNTISRSSAGNINYNRCCSSGDLIVMLCEEADLYTLIHEMAHQFGIKDHYCEYVNENETCKFKGRCDAHPDEDGNSRAYWCIMDNDHSKDGYTPWTDIYSRDINEIFCPDCKNELYEFLKRR